MLTTFEFFFQKPSITDIKSLTALLILSMSVKLEELIFLIKAERSLIKFNSSSLPLMIEHLLKTMCSLAIGMVIVKEV